MCMKRLTRLLLKGEGIGFDRGSVVSDKTLEPPGPQNDDSSTGSLFRLLDLPAEIILDIRTFLQYENIICLSLTCKTLHDLLFLTVKPSPKHHGHEALALYLIERDLPDLLTCAVHERLYNWRNQEDKQYRCPLCASKNRGRSTNKYVVCYNHCPSRDTISEQEKRLFLRHRLLGPQYGLPLNRYNHECFKSNDGYRDQVTFKVVNGTLMAWRVAFIKVAVQSDWHEPRTTPGDSILHICSHQVQCKAQLHKHLALQIIRRLQSETSEKGKRSTDLRRWIYKTIFRCHTCSTDIHYSVLEKRAPTEVIVRADAFQDLGGLGRVTETQAAVFGHTRPCIPAPDGEKTTMSMGCTSDLRGRWDREDDMTKSYNGGEAWDIWILGCLATPEDLIRIKEAVADADQHQKAKGFHVW